MDTDVAPLDPKLDRNKYPMVYAADYVRLFVGNPDSITISRSEALNAIACISEALGINMKNAVSQIADYYLAHKDSLVDKAAEDVGARLIREVFGT